MDFFLEFDLRCSQRKPNSLQFLIPDANAAAAASEKPKKKSTKKKKATKKTAETVRVNAFHYSILGNRKIT